jgi:hypothetical protein
VAEYRVYELDAKAEVARRHELEAESDADALTWAMALGTRHGAEIWEGERMVGAVPGTKPRMRLLSGRELSSPKDQK